jgi:AraC-like DNA-binding protein
MIKNLYLANMLRLEFLSGGYVKLNKKWYLKGKAFQFNILYYIFSGSAELSCNGETIALVPGNLYLLPAGLPIAYRCPEAMEQFFLHVTLTTPEGFDMLSGLKKVCRLPCSQEQLEQLKRLYYSEDYKHLLAFKSQVTQDVVSCLLREDVSFPTKPYSTEVLQAISYIQNNISIQLSGEQIAKAIFISPSRLHKRFKAETGLTLGAYQDRLIFYRATQLLAEKKLSIKEISQQLGFCDEHYFSRRFKEQLGMTPTGYRKYHLA